MFLTWLYWGLVTLGVFSGWLRRQAEDTHSEDWLQIRHGVHWSWSSESGYSSLGVF